MVDVVRMGWRLVCQLAGFSTSINPLVDDFDGSQPTAGKGYVGNLSTQYASNGL